MQCPLVAKWFAAVWLRYRLELDLRAHLQPMWPQSTLFSNCNSSCKIYFTSWRDGKNLQLAPPFPHYPLFNNSLSTLSHWNSLTGALNLSLFVSLCCYAFTSFAITVIFPLWRSASCILVLPLLVWLISSLVASIFDLRLQSSFILMIPFLFGHFLPLAASISHQFLVGSPTT